MTAGSLAAKLLSSIYQLADSPVGLIMAVCCYDSYFGKAEIPDNDPRHWTSTNKIMSQARKLRLH